MRLHMLKYSVERNVKRLNCDLPVVNGEGNCRTQGKPPHSSKSTVTHAYTSSQVSRHEGE